NDVKKLMQLLGEVLNQPNIARQYSRYFEATEARVAEVVTHIPRAERPRVLYCNLSRLTQEQLIGEWWIETAGGRSVTNNGRSTESLTFSMEQLFAWDSDVLILATPEDLKEAYRDPRFGKLQAIARHRVYVAPTGAHLWANRTIEQPLTLLWAAKIFYPEQ